MTYLYNLTGTVSGLTDILLKQRKKISGNALRIILSVILGIIGGFLALGLKTSVFWLRKILIQELEFDISNYLLLIYPGIGIMLTILFRRLINDKTPNSIASILWAISKRKSHLPAKKIISPILGSFFTAGFGGSVGIDAPIILSGAAMGSNAGKILHLDFKFMRLLLACGSAATMSAIFQTPLAAVVFAFEVLLIDISRFSLIPILISSVVGTIITKVLFHEDILFNFVLEQKYSGEAIPYYIIFAILIGLVAVYFTKTFLWIEGVFGKIKKQAWRTTLGIVIMGILLFVFPPLFGEGFETIKTLFNGNSQSIINNSIFFGFQNHFWVTIGFFTVLLLVKGLATSITMLAGGTGGVIAPALFMGALTGYLFATIVNSLGFPVHLNVSNFILIGMGGAVTGILHAPLTGLFMITETTAGYHLIVPLMLNAVITFLTVKAFGKDSIFTIHLARKGFLITHDKDKAILTFMSIRQVLEKDFTIVKIDETLGDLVKKIAKAHRNIFPVLDNEGKLKGVITLDDVREIMFNKELYGKIFIRNLMTKPLAVIFIYDNMKNAIEKFNKTEAWNLPVTDKEGHYYGFISKSKLFSVYRQFLVQLTSE